VDKSGSFSDNASPRRSTESLAAMRRIITPLFMAIPVLAGCDAWVGRRIDISGKTTSPSVFQAPQLLALLASCAGTQVRRGCLAEKQVNFRSTALKDLLASGPSRPRPVLSFATQRSGWRSTKTNTKPVRTNFKGLWPTRLALRRCPTMPGDVHCLPRPVARAAANNRFKRSRDRIFGKPGSGAMIWINQLHWTLAQSRVA
jgi:hypothetical protein